MLGGAVTECDLIVKGSVGGAPRGWKRLPSGLFQDDHGDTIRRRVAARAGDHRGPAHLHLRAAGLGHAHGHRPRPRHRARRPRQLPGRATTRPARHRRRRAGNACDATTTTTDCSTSSRRTPASSSSPDDTGTDPLVADTDGDAYPDGVEVEPARDPNDPQSFPEAVPGLPLPALALLARRRWRLGSADTCRSPLN